MSRRPIWRDYLHDREHGPLPAMLLALTVATGLVDAVSMLGLGRVFVANMTGNVVFVGFAVAHAPGFSPVASLLALAGFLAGAGFGGAAIRRLGRNRGVLLRDVVAVELLLVISAAALAAGTSIGAVVRDAMVALVAVGLGIQNAAVRSIAVPDITTSVLTMTLTGIAADVRARKPRVALRRGLSVATMLVGALVGAVLVLDVNVAAAMWAATAIIALVLLSAFAATKQDAPWQTRAGRAEQTTRPAAGGAMHGSPDARAGAGSVVA